MRRLPAGERVVAFAGTAKLIAASTSPGAVIRRVLMRLIRQFSQSGISWGKSNHSQDRCSERRPQPVQGTDFLSTGSGLPITNESRFRQILLDVPGSKCSLASEDKRLVGARLDAYLANIAAE